MRRGIALLLMFLAVPAFSQTHDSKLGVGDTVHITVFQQADLTSDARIGERGTVSMPLIGDVKSAGLARGAAAKLIASGLKKAPYLNSPQGTVALPTLRSRQVSVLGQV